MAKIGSKARGGYALILLTLITILIAMGLFAIRYAGPGVDMKTGKALKDTPWKEWDNLKMRQERGKLPKLTGEQQYWEDGMFFEGDVKLGKDGRGSLEMGISDDGAMIEGIWKGQFYIAPKLEHQVMMCSFNGLFDPEKRFADANGEDATKLYFLCKGNFVILESNYDNNRVRNVSGHIFVSGWLDGQKKITSRVIITSDSKNFMEYNFSAKARKQ